MAACEYLRWSKIPSQEAIGVDFCTSSDRSGLPTAKTCSSQIFRHLTGTLLGGPNEIERGPASSGFRIQVLRRAYRSGMDFGPPNRNRRPSCFFPRLSQHDRLLVTWEALKLPSSADYRCFFLRADGATMSHSISGACRSESRCAGLPRCVAGYFWCIVSQSPHSRSSPCCNCHGGAGRRVRVREGVRDRFAHPASFSQRSFNIPFFSRDLLYYPANLLGRMSFPPHQACQAPPDR